MAIGHWGAGGQNSLLGFIVGGSPFPCSDSVTPWGVGLQSLNSLSFLGSPDQVWERRSPLRRKAGGFFF